MSEINILAPAPVRTPLVDSNGLMTAQWVMYFQKLGLRVGGPNSQTVTQISESMTSSSVLSESVTGTDYGDDVEDLNRLNALHLPAQFVEPDDFLPELQSKEDPDDFIPEVPQYIDPENPTFVTLALSGQATATSATAGAATALPATPLGYLILPLNGTNVKVPYFAV